MSSTDTNATLCDRALDIKREGIESIQKYFGKWADEVWEHAWLRSEGEFESPIERLWYLAYRFQMSCKMCLGSPHGGLYRLDTNWRRRSPLDMDMCEPEAISKALATPSVHVADLIVPQHDVGRYRVDFALRRFFWHPKDEAYFAGPKLAVECDGHDFHERTKEQAAHDKSRDRFLQAEGFSVLRFTGSEIWRDPAKCAKEVDRFLWLHYDTLVGSVSTPPTLPPAPSNTPVG